MNWLQECVARSENTFWTDCGDTTSHSAMPAESTRWGVDSDNCNMINLDGSVYLSISRQLYRHCAGETVGHC